MYLLTLPQNKQSKYLWKYIKKIAKPTIVLGVLCMFLPENDRIIT